LTLRTIRKMPTRQKRKRKSSAKGLQAESELVWKIVQGSAKHVKFGRNSPNRKSVVDLRGATGTVPVGFARGTATRSVRERGKGGGMRADHHTGEDDPGWNRSCGEK